MFRLQAFLEKGNKHGMVNTIVRKENEGKQQETG